MRALETPLRAEFASLAAFYETDLKPWLAHKERDRRAAVVNFGILVGSIGTLALAVLLFAPFGEANAQLAVVVAVGGFGMGLAIVNRTRSDIAEGLLQRVAGKLGFNYRSRFERPTWCETFRTLKLLPNFNRESWEDEVKGRRNGVDFLLCEAHLQYKDSDTKKGTRTVFHGQLFLIDYPRRFLGETVVARDAGILNALSRPGERFQRVGLASSEFEKAFEAWSADQVEARELLDPLVLERFQELERLLRGKKLRAAFTGGRLLIAVETGDRLNMGSMFAPLENPARVEAILEEFEAIFNLIDALVKPVEGRLDGAFSMRSMSA